VLPCWSIALAVLAVVGAGCAGIDDTVDGSPTTKADAAGIMLDVRWSNDKDRCRESGSMAITSRPTDVLVLLDRSSSMDTAFGSGSRYQAVAGVLSQIVTTYQSHVRFGYMEMPGRVGCDAQSDACCASLPAVALGLGNAQAMVSALAEAAPLGGATPTAAALLAARLYYGALDDGVTNRYVLMATDGVPSCTLSGTPWNGTNSTSVPCQDALVQVQGLVSGGVHLLVLALGSDAVSSPGEVGCLDVLASAGGTALEPGNTSYYSATTPERLDLAIEQIFGVLGQPSCILAIPPTEDRSSVDVFLDGQEIPFGAKDGWHWLDYSWNIQITGAYCQQIQQFQVNGFEARYGCPVGCIDRGECTSPPPPS